MGQRVVELFAGVGGFRAGLERSGWETVWSDQWEPGRKVQHASECYRTHFGDANHHNLDITKVASEAIPDHDLLVGGFPCQDYSVATANARGITGKKGVLWWEIRRILQDKRPSYALLENVDRLLKSPSSQRGRDFGVMLWCLQDLGYMVEWREINAADYSAPQRRRRVFIFAAHERTQIAKDASKVHDVRGWLERQGFFAKPFPVNSVVQHRFGEEAPQAVLPKDLQQTSSEFAHDLQGAGLALGRKVWTYKVVPKSERMVTLGSVLEKGVDPRLYVPSSDIPKWKYLKGAKSEKRKTPAGFEYEYSEGPLPFPDPVDRPSRTVLTDEGGLSPSRFKHIILDTEVDRYRVLTPIEVERLDQFPDGWTDTGMPERFRYFCLGNALVVGLVERMGARLREISEGTLDPSPTSKPHRRSPIAAA
ncbi:MAG: DNA (cytosine-5-)-methyltransferase [Thermoplasmata archaeon]|nr:DNA (cytosine-5-)-methyltransferase [Thermoplasmata archaeon]